MPKTYKVELSTESHIDHNEGIDVSELGCTKSNLSSNSKNVTITEKNKGSIAIQIDDPDFLAEIEQIDLHHPTRGVLKD